MEQPIVPIMEGYPSQILEKLMLRDQKRKDALPPVLNGHPMQLVLEDLLLWDQQVLTVSFKGGTAELHKKIAETASAWSVYANIQFDFGYDTVTGLYRAWNPEDTSSIRVGFSEPGYWSFVGTDSQDPSITTHGDITLNLEHFDESLPQNWQGTVLHEFGHALGFHHEHQSPVANCDFDWETLYTYLSGPPNNWSKEQVDHNLKQMPAGGLTYSAHDKNSIMHYAFPEWMFLSGTNSPCFSQNNIALSDEDKRMAGEAYPFDEDANVNRGLQRSAIITQLKKFSEAFDHEALISLNARLSNINAGKSKRQAVFGNEQLTIEHQIKKAILIAGGQATEDPANLQEQISIGNLLPTDYAYQFLADLLDEIVKRYKVNASVKLAEVSAADTVLDCIKLIKGKL
jgi:hypothetical protein